MTVDKLGNIGNTGNMKDTWKPPTREEHRAMNEEQALRRELETRAAFSKLLVKLDGKGPLEANDIIECQDASAELAELARACWRSKAATSSRALAWVLLGLSGVEVDGLVMQRAVGTAKTYRYNVVRVDRQPTAGQEHNPNA